MMIRTKSEPAKRTSNVSFAWWILQRILATFHHVCTKQKINDLSLFPSKLRTRHMMFYDRDLPRFYADDSRDASHDNNEWSRLSYSYKTAPTAHLVCEIQPIIGLLTPLNIRLEVIHACKLSHQRNNDSIRRQLSWGSNYVGVNSDTVRFRGLLISIRRKTSRR